MSDRSLNADGTLTDNPINHEDSKKSLSSSISSRHPPSSKALAGLLVKLQILKGRNLVAKDRNFLFRRTSSDPYVKLRINSYVVGKTKMIPRTLNPTWNESFQLDLSSDEAANPNTQLEFIIFDHDTFTSDDNMGQVIIPIQQIVHQQQQDEDNNNGHYNGQSFPSSAKWYPVLTGQPGTPDYCKNATGELLIDIQIFAKQVLSLVRGNAHSLHKHRNIYVGLSWDMQEGEEIDLDASCVAVDYRGQVVMEDTVYFGNLENSNGSMVHSGDERTGETQGDDEAITCHLNDIPDNILALYFIITVVTPGKTLKEIHSAHVHFFDMDTRTAICNFVPSNLLSGEYTGMFLVRLARQQQELQHTLREEDEFSDDLYNRYYSRQESYIGQDGINASADYFDNGLWELVPIEDGDELSRDFGTMIPQIKGYTRDLVPEIHIDPRERVAVMRKHGVIRIRDYVHHIPRWVTFGLAWDITEGKEIDLDASAICLNEDLEPTEIVYFGRLESDDGCILHSGDERSGAAAGDDEKINFCLSKMDPNIKYVGVVVNSYSGEELDDVANAGCHLFCPETGREIATYTLTNSKELDKHTALIIGCLYRGEDGWMLRIISEPAQGRTAKDNISHLQEFLAKNPPPPPTSIPTIEDFSQSTSSLFSNSASNLGSSGHSSKKGIWNHIRMPDHVPHNNQEIILRPFSDFQKQHGTTIVPLPTLLMNNGNGRTKSTKSL